MKSGPQLSAISPATANSSSSPSQCNAATVSPHHLLQQKPSSDEELIRATISRQQQQRKEVFKSGLPFSIIRVVFNIISIALLLTDIPRSGIGISNLEKYFEVVEPDLAMGKGMPWNYVVFQSTLEEAESTSASVWGYKFDTTSIVWRAFAKHLNVSEFPSCLHYEEHCPGLRLSGEVVFGFMDSLVDAIAAKTYSPSQEPFTGSKRRLRTMMLRTNNVFYDRVHEYVLTGLFSNIVWRTNQALYLPEQAIVKGDGLDYSVPCAGHLRPVFCQEVWVNIDRMHCRGGNSCTKVGTVYSNALDRVKGIQDQFPNTTVDLTFLESFEDLRVSRMSIGAEATRGADVSTIIRARQCNSTANNQSESSCKTIYVEDYRYEADVYSTDVAQWYFVVVILRVCGQSYFFFRVAGLILSCYHAIGDHTLPEGQPLRTRIYNMLVILSKVPTQCIVYGSSFPIVCYTFAHLIDGSITYRILQMRFITQNGILKISLRGFVTVAIIQMRCVWVYATLTHLAVRGATSHRWVGWPRGVIGGISGVSEFSLTALSSITIIAQFRSKNLRSSRILDIWEVTSPGIQSVRGMRRMFTFGRRGSCSHFGGVAIDLKFLISCLLIIAAISFCRMCFRRIRQMLSPKTSQHYLDNTLWPLGRTPVSYSADILYPAVSLCVHWTSDFFCMREAAQEIKRLKQPARIAPPLASIMKYSNCSSCTKPQAALRYLITPTIKMDGHAFSIIQRQLESLHNRTSEVEGNIAFMNLVLMSDPIAYFQLRFGYNSRKTLAYYQSLEQPTRVLLLPESAVTVSNEPMCRLRRMRRVHIQDMRWSELVQCG